MIHMSVQQKTRKRLGTYGILLLVLLFVAICTWLTNGQPYITDEGEQAAVAGATFQQILMAPIAGFHNAGEVIGFVFCLGAFLALVNATGALETGIHVLVKKLKGKELVLVWVLMFLFSVGGTTYGMGEETVGFYILLAATMTAAGMDPVVGAATVLLGAGSGVLGSTINPFATGAAVEAARSAGVEVNMGILYLEGVILWLGTYLISVVGVTKYARHVIETKGSILTADQLSECQKAYGNMEISDEEKLTGRQKVCMIIFALTFVVMILGFIPWGDLNESIADGLAWTSILTGNALGSWWFDDAATWFMLMGIIIGIVGMTDRSKMATTIISGIGDMVSGMPAALFGFLDYILHIGLSFLVPSSSGLAALSAPIVSPIVSGLNWSVETSIMCNVAANGLVNLFTPTCGFIMGGLALARIPYETWLKWAAKLLVIIGVFVAVVLTVFMLVLS